MATPKLPEIDFSDLIIQPATKHQLWARVMIDGPTGAGKSVTSMRMAGALCGIGKSDGTKADRWLVIDTQAGQAAKYLGEDFGEGPLDFDVINIGEPFDPRKLTRAIELVIAQGKHQVVIIDTQTHFHNGPGGLLDQANKAGGYPLGWQLWTPVHARMMQTILNAPLHIISVVRSKMDYTTEEYQDSNGRTRSRVKKLGLQPEIRPDDPYEFDIVMSGDQDHNFQVTKCHFPAMDNQVFNRPGPDVVKLMAPYLIDGQPRIWRPDKMAFMNVVKSRFPVLDGGDDRKTGENIAGLLQELKLKFDTEHADTILQAIGDHYARLSE